jgi:hypothetical protein
MTRQTHRSTGASLACLFVVLPSCHRRRGDAGAGLSPTPPLPFNSTRRLDLPCSLTAYGWQGRLLQNDLISSVHRYILLPDATHRPSFAARRRPSGRSGKTARERGWIGLDWAAAIQMDGMELMDPWMRTRKQKAEAAQLRRRRERQTHHPRTPRPISTRRRPAWAWARFLFNRVPACVCCALRCVACAEPPGCMNPPCSPGTTGSLRV